MATQIGEDSNSLKDTAGVGDNKSINNSERNNNPKLGMLNGEDYKTQETLSRQPSSSDDSVNSLISELATLESQQKYRFIPETTLSKGIGGLGVLVDFLTFNRDLNLASNLAEKIEENRRKLAPGESKTFVVAYSTADGIVMTDNPYGFLTGIPLKSVSVTLTNPIPFDLIDKEQKQKDYLEWVEMYGRDIKAAIEKAKNYSKPTSTSSLEGPKCVAPKRNKPAGGSRGGNDGGDL